jgi:hypothetical protein
VARTSARLGDADAAHRAFDGMLLLAHRQGRAVERESLFVAASIALAEHDTLRAASAFEDVLRLDGFFDGKRTRTSRAPLLELTRITLSRGRPSEALGLARALRELDMVDSLAAARSADVGLADVLAARAYLALGRRDSALVCARRGVAALSFGLGPSSSLTREAVDLLTSLTS